MSNADSNDPEDIRRWNQVTGQSLPKRPGLFPPLTDLDYADALDQVVSLRTKASSSARTFPDFQGSQSSLLS